MNLPLLLIPGLMCDDAVWLPLEPWWPPGADVRVVDHGLADSLPAMARQLLSAAPPRFALAGHSMGGRVAMEVLRHAPQRVAGVALLDTGYAPLPAGQAGADETAKRQALLHLAQTQGVAAMARQWVQGMVQPARLADAALVDGIVAMMARKTAAHFAAQVSALLARPDAAPVLASLAVPTLLLCGAHDSWSPPAQHQQMLDLAPPGVADLVVVPEAGHMAPMERPEAVATALLAWLARVAPSA